jgi:hypothetical protein
MRFYDPDDDVITLFNKVREERFEGLSNVKIKLLMDSKPKIDKLRGTTIFASIKLTNDVERHLTTNKVDTEGYDYFLFIHELPWELANYKDKKRILSHELRHIFIDDKGNYKVINHDIEDFYKEIELNKDNPMWAQSLSTIAMAKYIQMKEKS